jgi:integrase
MKVNAKNERIKRKYLIHVRETRQLDDKSIDIIVAAIERFEIYTGRRDFREHRPEQAVAFKRHLAEERNKRTKERLSKATLVSTLNALRQFFLWLADQRGYKSRLNREDADYLRASLKDVATAKAPRQKRVPSLEEIAAVVRAMPNGTPVELRDRAIVAFIILTGARDDAAASFRMKHLDIEQRVLSQRASEARTKFAKTFDSWFFPVGLEFEAIVIEWKKYLLASGFGPEDPLFPATRVGPGPDGSFAVLGLARAAWSNADRIRDIFRAAFQSVGLPYANPHLFRDALMQLGYRLCRTPEELKAWSRILDTRG